MRIFGQTRQFGGSVFVDKNRKESASGILGKYVEMLINTGLVVNINEITF